MFLLLPHNNRNAYKTHLENKTAVKQEKQQKREEHK